ncbi:MAG TPA: JDVT-CTERM system glutamic-type intramembrane protease [Acidimicrobiales bacterium]
MISDPLPHPQLWRQPGPPPGWYGDPWRWAWWRWWDGSQWTPYLYGHFGPGPGLAPAPPAEFEPKGPGIKGGGIAAIGIGIGYVLSFAVALGYFATGPGHLDTQNPWFMLVSQLALWVGFLGAVVVASWRNGTHSLVRDYGLSWPTGRDLTAGLTGGFLGRVPSTLILILIVVASNGFNNPNAAGRDIDGATPEGTAGWVIMGLLLVVGAPIVEELLFRGLIQGAFTRRLGATPAIFVTALIFCFAHVLNEGPFAPFILFPPALILGYLRHRSQRLAPGMIAHATFNGIAFALLLVPAFR